MQHFPPVPPRLPPPVPVLPLSLSEPRRRRAAPQLRMAYVDLWAKACEAIRGDGLVRLCSTTRKGVTQAAALQGKARDLWPRGDVIMLRSAWLRRQAGAAAGAPPGLRNAQQMQKEQE